MTTVDKIIIEWFNSDFGTNFSGGVVGNLILIFLSLAMAAVLAGIFGFERESHGHSAGLRTHLLISIGSAVVMIISIYGFGAWDAIYTANGVSRDPARLAAQVVAGIGFIGAGSIVKNGISVRGLTTATTLWISMTIGLACGSGNFIIAIAGTFIALVALISMRKIETRLAKKQPFLTLVFPADKPIMKELLLTAQRYSISLLHISNEVVEFQEQSAIRMTMSVSSPSSMVTTNFLDEVREHLKPIQLKVNSEN